MEENLFQSRCFIEQKPFKRASEAKSKNEREKIWDCKCRTERENGVAGNELGNAGRRASRSPPAGGRGPKGSHARFLLKIHESFPAISNKEKNAQHNNMSLRKL